MLTEAHVHAVPATADAFPRDPAGLPEARRPAVVELADGVAVGLRIAPVAKRIGEGTVGMLAFGGSVPGPTLRVRQGSEVVVHVKNDGDLPQTVRFHGVGPHNRHGGSHRTQAPMAGGSFAYRLTFPDPGVYWYHPHVRDDDAQELGLYGAIVVEPAGDGYWAPANRELAVTLGDAPDGDLLLVNGETGLRLDAQVGEVVRLYLVNAARARVLNLSLHNARMKLVGGDAGRVEQEAFVDEVPLAPSERAVVDVLFDRPGLATLEHHQPGRCYPLGRATIGAAPAVPSFAAEFAALRRRAWLEVD